MTRIPWFLRAAFLLFGIAYLKRFPGLLDAVLIIVAAWGAAWLFRTQLVPRLRRKAARRSP
jgi:hypothetical protein